MSDAKTAEACNRVLRAALAGIVSEREGIPLASEASPDQRTYLGLVQFDLLGYPMGDSLLPLVQLNQGDDGQDSDDDDVGITWLDQQIDDTKADLHDRLLNLSPQLGSEISVLNNANPVLNLEYEKALRDGKFAGALESTSPEIAAAREFLFPVSDEGLPTKSAAYLLYESFEEDITDLDDRIATAASSGDDVSVGRLTKRRERKHAEWVALGQKRRVEEAIRLVNSADLDIGFEDERLRFIDILEQRKVGRLASAQEYARVDIRPLEPLIDPEESNHWRAIEITGAQIPELCPAPVRHRFGLSLKDIETAEQAIVAFKCEVATVMLIREWLSEEFLTARYWKLDGDLLSDGAGGGKIATQTSRAIFVRNASYRIDGELKASKNHAGTKKDAVNLVPLFKKVETPVLAQLTKVTGNARNGTAIANLSAEARTKLTTRQMAKVANLVALQKPVNSIGQNARIAIGSKAGLRRGIAAAATTQPSTSATARIARPNPMMMASLGAVAKLNSASLLKPNARVRGRRRGGRAARAGTARPAIAAATARAAAAARIAVPPRTAAVRRPSRGGRRAPPAQPSIKRSGTIMVGPMVEEGDFHLTYQRRINGGNMGPETAVELASPIAGQFRFSLVVPPHFLDGGRSKKLTDIVVRLRGEDGGVLDETTIAFGASSALQTIAWTISRDVSLLEMTAPAHPILFGYGLELIPKAPNPDDTLDWSGNF